MHPAASPSRPPVFITSTSTSYNQQVLASFTCQVLATFNSKGVGGVSYKSGRPW